MNNPDFCRPTWEMIMEHSVLKSAIRPNTNERAETLGNCGYAMLRSGPAVNASEVEMASVEVAEITISWGDSVLTTEHLALSRSYWVGEQTEQKLPVDFLLPAERLGTTRMPIVVAEAGQSWVVIPAGASGYLRTAQGREKLETIRERAEATVELEGAVKFPLALGSTLVFEFGGFVFRVGRVSAGKATPRGVLRRLDSAVASAFGISVLTVAGFIGTLAYTQPAAGLTAEDGIDKDQVRTMMQFLSASAEKSREAAEAESGTEAKTGAPGGQEGEQAKSESGKMGKTTATATNRRAAAAGDAPKTVLSRQSELEQAQTGGMIGILTGSTNSGRNVPSLPWAEQPLAGSDAKDGNGNMWGDSIGDSMGLGGLGPSGIGEGGGGRGLTGYGISSAGTVGGGLGSCAGERCPGFGRDGGIGNGVSRLPPGHATRTPTIRPSSSVVSGRLPPEVIQRVVRNNFGRFRGCYEQGLARNPNLEGRVAVSFVIGSDGGVSYASAGGDLPDSGVTSCVSKSFYSLSFPAPETGIVKVTYPIMFSPG